MQPSKELLPVEYADAKCSPFVVSGADRKPVMGPVVPSSVLSRVQMFLPQMEHANRELQQRIEKGENVSIEKQQQQERDGVDDDDDDEQPMITLDVGLVPLQDDGI